MREIIEKESDVVICNNCKSFYIKPIIVCECGCKTFSNTHPYNKCLAKNI